MRKKIILSLAVASMITGLQAGGDIGGVVSIENEVVPAEVTVAVKAEPKKAEKAPAVEEKSGHSDFYVVAKGLYITGDDADAGYGAGLDVGYRLTENLAVELGGTYAKNTIDGDADKTSYKTGAVSLVYTVHATDDLGIFAKAGYMMEQVHDEDESGIAYGGGVEYKMGDTTALVAEYETSNIDGTRGDAVSLGLMYNF